MCMDKRSIEYLAHVRASQFQSSQLHITKTINGRVLPSSSMPMLLPLSLLSFSSLFQTENFLYTFIQITVESFFWLFHFYLVVVDFQSVTFDLFNKIMDSTMILYGIKSQTVNNVPIYHRDVCTYIEKHFRFPRIIILLQVLCQTNNDIIGN